ncbi:MAG TPA: SIMPL domain-containing protein [Bryobacteraceae bacterium]|nr:SIMPL domain-containing protein [Bryobacteraceae bacterium]
MFRAISIACAAAAMCCAQPAVRPASITAVGSSSISVAPDLARVDVGVNTQAATAQAASQANATLASAVIMALQSLLGSSGSIKTVNYSLSPVYSNPSPGQPAVIIGFSVNNTVETTLTDLSKIGPTVDTAIQSGANSVQGISFDLQDRNPPTAQALKTAAASAMSQAAAIAAGLNVHTGAVLHASEGVTLVPQVVGVAAPVAGPVSTPVQTGLVIIQASVTLEVALAP